MLSNRPLRDPRVITRRCISWGTTTSPCRKPRLQSNPRFPTIPFPVASICLFCTNCRSSSSQKMGRVRPPVPGPRPPTDTELRTRDKFVVRILAGATGSQVNSFGMTTKLWPTRPSNSGSVIGKRQRLSSCQHRSHESAAHPVCYGLVNIDRLIPPQ